MGRTLLGVDLDESAVGGLVERLLTDEELEKLADGGRPAGSDDANTEGGTAPGEREGDDDASETVSGSDVAFADEDETTERLSGSDVTFRDDSGSESAGRASATGPTGGRNAIPSISPGDDEESDESGGFVSQHRSLLIKGGAAVLLLGVVGVVIWRYGGKIKGLVPGLGGGSDEDETSHDAAERDDAVATGAAPTRRTGGSMADSGVSPARRRAKVGARAERDDDRSDDLRRAADDASDASDGRGGDATEKEPSASTGDLRDDVDLGALVGLGTLALISALVRKFGEDRPRDPLVDGPEE